MYRYYEQQKKLLDQDFLMAPPYTSANFKTNISYSNVLFARD